jgi:hypothetical protein
MLLHAAHVALLPPRRLASLLSSLLANYLHFAIPKSEVPLMKVKLAALVIALLMACARPARAQGNLSANPYAPDSTSNPYGAGSPFNPNSVNNPYGRYGSPFSPRSANNPYTTDAPRLYDSQGNYHGKLSANPYDPDSTSNPFGRYGSPYSPDSIKNPFGAGSPYRNDSPTNPYGTGMHIQGNE